jgi:hypothetical protein
MLTSVGRTHPCPLGGATGASLDDEPPDHVHATWRTRRSRSVPPVSLPLGALLFTASARRIVVYPLVDADREMRRPP